MSTLFASSLAFAATVMLYPGAGVGGARLGARDSTAVAALKKSIPLKRSAIDNNYAGQKVYEYFFGNRIYTYRNGKRVDTGNYPVEMYANKLHRVFIFEINASTVVTSKGIRIGSTEAQLKRAYGTALKRPRITPTYYIYSSGGASNRTDFYVSKSTRKITRVLISRY